MALNIEQIAKLGILRDLEGQRKQPEAASLSSCHLTVGSIICPGGEEINQQEFKLEPQQMVVVVSAEQLRLPERVVGYVMPRYTLNDQGILALSTGTVDPGYEGPVSSTLINFSNDDYPLKKAEAFLRVTFHQVRKFRQLENSQNRRNRILLRQAQNNYSDTSVYVEERKGIAKKFPSTFLNIPLTAEKIAKQEAEARFKRLDSTITYAGIVLAAVTILFGIVAFFVGPKVQELTTSSISNSAAVQVAKDQIPPIEDDITSLTERVNSLEEKQAESSE